MNIRNNPYVENRRCRICGSIQLIKFLDFDRLPLPNGFVSKQDLGKKESIYPLQVVFCNNCALVQLKHIVNSSIMFKNYLYIPSSSNTRIEHFRELAEISKERFHLSSNDLVVDIGSNDGSLLNCFKNLDVGILGVDPAENLVEVARLNGIPTLRAFFSPYIAKKITQKYKKASLALATNVLAHISNLKRFMEAIDILLDRDGIFICQFPYLLDLVQKNQFDTIYHEHLSYFSLKPLLILTQDTNLEIFDVERNELDGGSIRVLWKKRQNIEEKVKTRKINNILREEKEYGLYDVTIFDQFSKNIKSLKSETRNTLFELKKKGKTIVGYGAAAKGNIFLNYFGIDNKILDYIVDSTPYKQGLFTPGTKIPIYNESKIYDTRPDYILILAWNFKDEIMLKNKRYKDMGGKFILAIPNLQII